MKSMNLAPAIAGAIAAALLMTPAAAADDPHHPGKPESAAASQGQSGMPMTGMMQQMMGGSMMGQCDRVEGSLAFLKAELKITDAQSSAWDSFAGKLRELSDEREQKPTMGMMGQENESWPDKISGMSQHASDHAARLKALADATAPLYASLSNEQKKTADEIFPMTLCVSGAMGMRMEMPGRMQR